MVYAPTNITFKRSGWADAISALRKTVNDHQLLKLQTEMSTMARLITKQDQDNAALEKTYNTQVGNLSNLTGQLFTLDSLNTSDNASEIVNTSYSSSLAGLQDELSKGRNKKVLA